MVPVFEAVVTRRLLINYRLDPAAVEKRLPPPLEPLLCAGAGIGGISLVRIEGLRPRALRPVRGLALEVLAHRVAVTAPAPDGLRRPGMHVLRRDVERRLMVALGGKLFGGEHRLSLFEVEEDERRIRAVVNDEEPEPLLDLAASWGAPFQPSATFSTLGAAVAFLSDCEGGFTRAGGVGGLEAVRLTAQPSRLEGVRLEQARVRLFEDGGLFPPGSAELDSALGERRLPLEWVALRELSELPDDPLLPVPA